MRILVAGPLPQIRGHLTRGIADGFGLLGHEVRVLDTLRFRNTARFKVYNRLRQHWRSLAAVASARRNQELLNDTAAFGPDLVFIVRGEMITRCTVERLRRDGAVVAFWCPDDPYQCGTEVQAAEAADHVFVFDRHYEPALRARGVRSVHVLPMACDPSVHRPRQLTEREAERFRSEICFVGTWYPNRDRILAGLADLPISVWGGGWKLPLIRPGHPLRDRFRGSAIGDDVVLIYNATRLVLNIQHPQSVTAQNMRTFEAPACGAACLTGWTDELPKQFAIGREIFAYRAASEIRGWIEHCRRNPEAVRQVAHAGRERARRDHSYRARAEQALDLSMAAGHDRAARSR